MDPGLRRAGGSRGLCFCLESGRRWAAGEECSEGFVAEVGGWVVFVVVSGFVKFGDVGLRWWRSD